jgi:NitT/TauT family transport system substrate-binding protein
MSRKSRVRFAVPLAVGALVSSAACATTPTTAAAGRPQQPGSATPTSDARTLRLGYFANITHATAVYGVGSGAFQRALGGTRLKTQVFNAGPAAVEALFAGSLDATFIGPNPAINAFVKSNGEAIRIVAGATSGGASLVVQPEITDAGDLRGKKIASPQTGGTQDIALRHYLADEGYRTDERGAGEATIVAQENGLTLDLFRSGGIDGAWVPEPWASRLVLEGGGKVLVDEKDLWPGGQFVTTHLIVRTEFLRKHPDTVRALLRGALEASNALNAGAAAEPKKVVDAELQKLSGKALQPATLDRAFSGITITLDPIAWSLKTSAEHAFATGLVKRADLAGIYDLTLLREILGKPVDDAGLGNKS